MDFSECVPLSLYILVVLTVKCPAVNPKEIYYRAVDCLHLQCKQGFSQG